MSLSSYVLIIRGQTTEAVAAANVYIKWVIIGEVAIFSAFCIINYMQLSQQVIAAPLLQFMGLMLIIGFGIKIGLLGFHSWLPLAHPVAAVPASALLSGFMVKAGMIGWLRFFPFQATDVATFYHLGLFTICLGIAGVFYAAIKGLGQKNPKAVLAYSTVSQMGILSACFGVILAFPSLKEAMTLSIIFYALHHGLAKSALFLSVGVAPFLNKQSVTRPYLRNITYFVMILPALSLVGAPFTSGYFAKAEVKLLLNNLPYLKYAIVISAVFTGLLMCRFVHMSYYKAQQVSAEKVTTENGLLMVCLLNTLLVILAPLYLLNQHESIANMLSMMTIGSVFSALLPVVLAIAIYKGITIFKLNEWSFSLIKSLKLTEAAQALYARFKLMNMIEKENVEKWLFITYMKTMYDKKLSPQESMPLNMQSTYVSLLLISVGILLLVAFGV